MKSNFRLEISREKIFTILYAVLLFIMPILVISVLPWAKHMAELYGYKMPMNYGSPIIFEDIVSYVSIVINGLVAGFGIIFLGMNISKYASRLAFLGCLAGLTYALLASMRYPLFLVGNLAILEPLLYLIRYSSQGSYTTALMIGVYFPLLFKIIRQRNQWKLK